MTMMIKYSDIGLIKNHLYEVLVTTFNDVQDKIIPNTASMGIRVIDNDILIMTPYSDTKTYKNLKLNGLASINFVNNVYLYSLASLKDPNSDIGLKEFPLEYYSYYEIINERNNEKIQFPYIKQAWAASFCEVFEEKIITKQNSLGEIKLSEFKLRKYVLIKNRDSFKLINRAENLIIEILILVTRLKVTKERKNQRLFEQIYKKVIDQKQDIERFTKNTNVIKALDLISRFVSTLLD
jgi:hypothetical protein